MLIEYFFKMNPFLKRFSASEADKTDLELDRVLQYAAYGSGLFLVAGMLAGAGYGRLHLWLQDILGGVAALTVGILVAVLLQMLALFMLRRGFKEQLRSAFLSKMSIVLQGGFVGVLFGTLGMVSGSMLLPMVPILVFSVFVAKLALHRSRLISPGVRLGNVFAALVFGAAIAAVLGLPVVSMMGEALLFFRLTLYIMVGVATLLYASFALTVAFDRLRRIVEQGVTPENAWLLAASTLFGMLWLYVAFLAATPACIGRLSRLHN